MKKLHFATLSLGIILAASLTACSNNEAGAPVQSANPSDSTAVASAANINIRYIDEDSISANYNLAKDFKEASIRAFSKLESAQQSRGAEIQRFGAQIEEKMRSNGYLSEASYNADVAKFQKMQQDAQNYLANLQRNTEQELAQQQAQLQDSLTSFIKEYNAKKGYDAILFKAAGVYFNPALDITNEVIEGLNARYNKVSESK